MADEKQTQETQQSAAAGAPNKGKGTAVAKLQKWGPAMQAALGRLKHINLAQQEEASGVFLKPQALAKAMDFDNHLFAAYLAQRTRLAAAKRPTTVDSMLDLKNGGADLRADVMVTWFKTRKLPEYEIMCRVPPGDPALKGFIAFMNDGVKLLLKEEYFGKGAAPAAPKYTAVGVGIDTVDVADTMGHSEVLKAAQAARAGQKA